MKHGDDGTMTVMAQRFNGTIILTIIGSHLCPLSAFQCNDLSLSSFKESFSPEKQKGPPHPKP
jgi:hypothetical protein